MPASKSSKRYPVAVQDATVERQEGTPPHHYEPSAIEQATIDAHKARKASAAPRTKLKVEMDGNKANMRIDHQNFTIGAALIEMSLGTTDWQVAEALVGHLGQLANDAGAVNETTFQHAVALAQGVQARDEVEAMLATQMAAIHLATMDYAAKLHRSTTVQASEAYERSLTRLSRTFAAQVDALKKYRTKGEQRVIVEHQHVHIYPGGQAVVGTFNQGGALPGEEGAQSETEGQSHEREQVLLSERASMLGPVETLGLAVQGTGADGEEGLPVPRRPGGSALGAT
jgi:hypothetical protein